MLTVLLVLAFAILVYRRGIHGYRDAPPGLACLHAGEAAFVESVAEVLFPGGGGCAVAGIDADLPHSIDRHLAALPRSKRFQIRALFALIEHGTLLYPGREPGGRRRFSSLTAASRIDLLMRMAQDRRPALRLLLTALRSIFVLGYLGHPANLSGLGLAPFEIPRVESDAERLFPRIGGLPGLAARDASEDAPSNADAHGAASPGRVVGAIVEPLGPSAPRHRAYLRALSTTTEPSDATGRPGVHDRKLDRE